MYCDTAYQATLFKVINHTSLLLRAEKHVSHVQNVRKENNCSNSQGFVIHS